MKMKQPNTERMGKSKQEPAWQPRKYQNVALSDCWAMRWSEKEGCFDAISYGELMLEAQRCFYEGSRPAAYLLGFVPSVEVAQRIAGLFRQTREELRSDLQAAPPFSPDLVRDLWRNIEAQLERDGLLWYEREHL